MSIPQRLSAAIQAKGLTIKQFCDTTELPYRSAQNYLRGERTPNAETVATICARMGISANWLLLGLGPMALSEDPPGLQKPTSADVAVADPAAPFEPSVDGQAVVASVTKLAEQEQRGGVDAGSGEIVRAGLVAIHHLAGSAVREASEGNGRIVLAAANVQPGTGRTLGRELVQELRQRVTAAETESAGEEHLAVVLSVVVKEGK